MTTIILVWSLVMINLCLPIYINLSESISCERCFFKSGLDFVLVESSQQGILVIFKELIFTGEFDIVSVSFRFIDVTTELFEQWLTTCKIRIYYLLIDHWVVTNLYTNYFILLTNNIFKSCYRFWFVELLTK